VCEQSSFYNPGFLSAFGGFFAGDETAEFLNNFFGYPLVYGEILVGLDAEYQLLDTSREEPVYARGLELSEVRYAAIDVHDRCYENFEFGHGVPDAEAKDRREREMRIRKTMSEIVLYVFVGYVGGKKYVCNITDQINQYLIARYDEDPSYMYRATPCKLLDRYLKDKVNSVWGPNWKRDLAMLKAEYFFFNAFNYEWSEYCFKHSRIPFAQRKIDFKAQLIRKASQLRKDIDWVLDLRLSYYGAHTLSELHYEVYIDHRQN